MPWLVVAVVALGLLVLYRAWLSERVGRLQSRVQATRATLDLQLDRRAHAARDVDATVAVAALAALEAAEDERELAESALTRALRGAWDTSWPTGVRGRVSEANERLHLSRQFHSAALTALMRLQRRPLVRALRVAGGRPEGYVEIDDTLPEPDEAVRDGG